MFRGVRSLAVESLGSQPTGSTLAVTALVLDVDDGVWAFPEPKVPCTPNHQTKAVCSSAYQHRCQPKQKGRTAVLPKASKTGHQQSTFQHGT